MKIVFENPAVEDILDRVICLNSYVTSWVIEFVGGTGCEVVGGTGCGLNEKDVMGFITYLEIQNAMMQAAMDIDRKQAAPDETEPQTQPTIQAA